MSKTVSARISTALHDELRERCNLIGESINDFIKASIEFALHNSCDFDFGDDVVEELEIQKSEFAKNKKL
jgi:predicted DNA-binding protein